MLKYHILDAYSMYLVCTMDINYAILVDVLIVLIGWLNIDMN